MNPVVSRQLSLIAKIRAKDGRFLPVGACAEDLKKFITQCKIELGTTPPIEYIDFLKIHNGFTVEGVFLYSTGRLPISGSTGKTLAFVEINVLSGDLDQTNCFLVFGDSDQDEYVLELSSGKYQVRDKQAFDNVYEEFSHFDELLAFMLDMVLRRIE
jgi:hypothetical protein